ncbi:MAG: hypothetical protein ACWA5A_10205 [Marinibacterium sp.]
MQKAALKMTIGMGLLALGAHHVNAQGNGNCEPRSVLVDRLADQFGESRQSIGLGNNNAMVETFASGASGTWTIIVTLPSGVSCLMAAGDSFEQVQEPIPTGEPV